MASSRTTGARPRTVRGDADVVTYNRNNATHRAAAREAGGFGAPDPAAEAEWRRNMGEAEDADEEWGEAHRAPSGGLTPRQYARKLPTPTLRPSLSDGSGFAFGLVLYAVGLCYIRGGWTGPGGVTDWMRAKFLNRTRAAA